MRRLTGLTLSPPNKLLSAKYILSFSIFKVLQRRSKLVKMLSECQTVELLGVSSGSKLFSHGTVVVSGGLRVTPQVILQVVTDLFNVVLPSPLLYM